MPASDKAGFAYRAIWNIGGPSGSGSIQLDVGRPDHLAPSLSFLDEELPQVGRRDGKRNAAQVGKARLDVGVGESGVDRIVELVDRLGGRVLGRTNAEPRTRL